MLGTKFIVKEEVLSIQEAENEKSCGPLLRKWENTLSEDEVKRDI